MPLRTKMEKHSRIGKLHALAGGFAMRIAKERHDPSYIRMIKFKKAWRMLKIQILRRYKSKGMAAARIAATGHKQEFHHGAMGVHHELGHHPAEHHVHVGGMGHEHEHQHHPGHAEVHVGGSGHHEEHHPGMGHPEHRH